MTNELVERVARAIASSERCGCKQPPCVKSCRCWMNAQAALDALKDGATWDGKQVVDCAVIDQDFAEARCQAAEKMRERCALLMPQDDTTAVLVGGEIIAVFRWADQAQKWANAAGNYQGRAEFRRQPAICALEVSDE